MEAINVLYKYLKLSICIFLNQQSKEIFSFQ